jgi:ABC-2 type transport system ATP-binding protein
MNAVECRNVTKRFEQHVAVNDLSFSVSEGAVFGLLGPNGAGKTTTLRMIVDIFAPDSGEILVLGETMAPHILQRTGYLPEERGLYKKMKVGEQLLFFARLKGIEKGEARRRIDHWLERLGLSDWKDKPVDSLSKGMQQKVQFIVSVLSDPVLLILDEPFSGLDPVSVGLLKGVVMDLKERGRTIIFSSHQMEQVEQLCDEICLVDRATKILGGRLKDIKRQFGKDSVLLDYEGSAEFLSDARIEKVIRHPHHVEVVLAKGHSPQILLEGALKAGATINRFERSQVTLNEIFIESVTKGNGQGPNSHPA